ncbi:MAG: CopG family antitoxin [Dehalococcoidia bacterium]|nr:CopG family antitoxin [Dehalococcoidia bacterium]
MARNEQEEAQSTKRSNSRIPRFRTIEEEAEFWDTHDLSEFEDELEEVEDVRFVVRRARQNRALTVRIDEETLATVTKEAAQQGVGSSTLIRMWILERLHKGPRHHNPADAA